MKPGQMARMRQLTAQVRLMRARQRMIDSGAGYRGECDGCHLETTVLLDEDTVGEGDFEYCKACIEGFIERTKKHFRSHFKGELNG